VAALWLAAVPAAALAQSPSGPDAAPGASASGGPSPDPAPAKSKPKPAVAKRAVVPAAVITTRRPAQSTAAPAATTVAPPRHVTTKPHRKEPARRKHHAAAKAKPTPHRTVAHAPSLPRLDPIRLVAPTTDPDAGRARNLAAGALSLLILALASALLLAFTARVERRRVVR
jgi:hypothetical protein